MNRFCRRLAVLLLMGALVSPAAADGGKYVQKVFNIVNQAYANLYGYSQMNERQIQQYADTYLQCLDTRLLAIVEDENNEPIAMGVGIGSP